MSNTFRGLLCNNCNLGLGLFKDNPINLRRAFGYIIYHNKKNELRKQKEQKKGGKYITKQDLQRYLKEL